MNQPLAVPLVFVLLFLLAPLFTATDTAAATTTGGGAYAKLEASFELPQVRGNAFDFTANDVKVTFTGPGDRDVTVPAFFDGGTTWRARHTPTATGQHTIKSVTLNGADARPQGLAVREFNITADAKRSPGFVRIHPADKFRFAFDDGTPYYPVGYNLAWRHLGQPPGPPLVESIARAGKARANWTRIWMNHWDSKNLDWLEDVNQQPKLGQLSLAVAKTWDEVVAACEANGVYFQMVLQHHGQYSTTANNNWGIHPWNKANGGWLDSPAQFFTDPRAVELTKAKYRYIIARWGYSPAVMAWELFNEVEYTDAFRSDLPAVAKWHGQMAAFLREHDAYKHLVTTSSRTTEKSIWPATDYYQSHVYPPDILSAIQTLEAEQLDRAYFYGEIGGSAEGTQINPGDVLHRTLWGSITGSRAAGAAQYWYWNLVDELNLQPHVTAAQGFIEQSGFLNHPDMRPIDVSADTANRGPMRFGPGSGWAASKGTQFVVHPSGRVEGLGGMSAYLQGMNNNRPMFPFAEFKVTYAEPGTFAVRLDEVQADGARLEVSLDGRRVGTLDFGPAPQQEGGGGGGGGGQQRPQRRNPRVNAAIEIPVPAGEHTVRLENTGADWVHLRQFVLTPYASELGVLAKGDRDLTVLWVYRREQAEPPREGARPTTRPATRPVTGTLRIPGLPDGSYTVAWWDAYAGKVAKEETVRVSGGQPLELQTPPVEQDLAAWVRRADAR